MMTMQSLSSDTLCLLTCRMKVGVSVLLLKTEEGGCVPHTVVYVDVMTENVNICDTDI